MKSEEEIKDWIKRYEEEVEETPPWGDDNIEYREKMKAKIEVLKMVID